MNQPINRSTNQSIDQPMNQPIKPQYSSPDEPLAQISAAALTAGTDMDCGDAYAKSLNISLAEVPPPPPPLPPADRHLHLRHDIAWHGHGMAWHGDVKLHSCACICAILSRPVTRA